MYVLGIEITPKTSVLNPVVMLCKAIVLQECKAVNRITKETPEKLSEKKTQVTKVRLITEID